jgi:adenylosuccinate lyase
MVLWFLLLNYPTIQLQNYFTATVLHCYTKNVIDALSPLDGRYESQTSSLRPFFSEEALIKYRLMVEIRWFQALAKEPKIKELPHLTISQNNAIEILVVQFDAKQAQEVKKIEASTNHDVKAVEYYLKKKLEKIVKKTAYLEFVHFGLTSEDVNNLAYGMMIHHALKKVIAPDLQSAITKLSALARSWKNVDLLSLTHGQPATPTTMRKEMEVFVDRLDRQFRNLKSFKMQGKFGGAVGTYSAHRAAYPEFKWEEFGRKFVTSLGLSPLTNATQINPHDDLAELSHTLSRINTIWLDFCRDVWLYILRGVFKQSVIKGEVGSSTMPHKVNPIDFENAEGNLGLSNALFAHFAEKLPVSRLQRDLSDSTVQRNIGSAFGYHTLAISSLLKGLNKISLNKNVIQLELDAHPEVLAEPIQMVLRKYGIDGYEKLKKLTRGEKITTQQFSVFIDGLDIPDTEKKRLKEMMR